MKTRLIITPDLIGQEAYQTLERMGRSERAVFLRLCILAGFPQVIQNWMAPGKGVQVRDPDSAPTSQRHDAPRDASATGERSRARAARVAASLATS